VCARARVGGRDTGVGGNLCVRVRIHVDGFCVCVCVCVCV